MGSVRIISKSTVCAANHKQPNLNIHLTPFDLQFLTMGYIQKGFLFRKPNPSFPANQNSQSTLFHHLTTSLSRTLDFFPPHAGRLATIDHNDGTATFFIDCNNAGAEFVHAVAEGVCVDDIIEAAYVPQIVESFFPLNGAMNYEGTFKPLLAVQVTELVDGIFIAFTMNHVVHDGPPFIHFITSWSEISRGFECISKLPVLQRWFIYGNNDCSIRIPRLRNMETLKKSNSSPVKIKVFHFTKEYIAKLKAKANAELRTNKISSLQALLSHLWRCSVRNQNLDPDQEINYCLMIHVGRRMHPPLPLEYFGNLVVSATVTMKVKDQLERGLGYVAMQMNKLVAMHTGENIRKSLESWKENPRLLTVDSMAKNALFTSSSPNFDFFSPDFGWGRPIAVRSGLSNMAFGKITLFPGVEEGSIDIEACFSDETLQKMILSS